MWLVLLAHLFGDARLFGGLNVHHIHSVLLKSGAIFGASPAVAYPIGPVRGRELPEGVVIPQEVERAVEIAVIAQVNFVARRAAWPQEPANLLNRAVGVGEVFKAGLRQDDVL